MGQCNNCTGDIKISICKTSVDGHSSYALSEWNWFWNQLKNEQLETDSYKSQIKYFIFCKQFLMPLKIFSVNQFRYREGRKFHFQFLQNFPGKHAPWPRDPPRSSCLRHSTFAPAARMVQVHQLDLWLRYLQMLPKTPSSSKFLSLGC